MKIKGPGGYPRPPEPPDAQSGKVGNQSTFTPGSVAEEASVRKAPGKSKVVTPFETDLKEISGSVKAGTMNHETAVTKVVESVLSDLLGKDFLSRADSASLREKIGPFIAQDDVLAGKLQSILSRIGKSGDQG